MATKIYCFVNATNQQFEVWAMAIADDGRILRHKKFKNSKQAKNKMLTNHDIYKRYYSNDYETVWVPSYSAWSKVDWLYEIVKKRHEKFKMKLMKKRKKNKVSI